MEDMHDQPAGKQLYILSQDDYSDLHNIVAMLILMAQMAYNDEDRETGRQRLVLTRSEVHFVFMEISAQINDALNGVRRENSMGPRSGVWQ